MNRTIQLKKFIWGGPLTAIAVSAMLLLGSASSANAGHYQGHTFGGVVTGGALGGLLGGAIGGKKGIIPGVVGGAIVGGALSSRPPAPRPPPRTYYPPTPVYNSGLVYNIQTSLSRLGYNPGPIDGVYGRRTADAIGLFEYHRKRPVTGQATPEIYYAMQQAGG